MKQQQLSIEPSDINMQIADRIEKRFGEMEEMRICRICLQTYLESREKLITPCQCSGSVKYVHQTCFKKWAAVSIKSKLNQEKVKILKAGFSCEICKYVIDCELQQEVQCVTCSQLYKRMKSMTLAFILFAISLLIILLMIIFLMAYIIVKGESSHTAETIAVCASIILLFILLIIIGKIAMRKLWLSKTVKVKNIKERRVSQVQDRIVRGVSICSQLSLKEK